MNEEISKFYNCFSGFFFFLNNIENEIIYLNLFVHFFNAKLIKYNDNLNYVLLSEYTSIICRPLKGT